MKTDLPTAADPSAAPPTAAASGASKGASSVQSETLVIRMKPADKALLATRAGRTPVSVWARDRLLQDASQAAHSPAQSATSTDLAEMRSMLTSLLRQQREQADAITSLTSAVTSIRAGQASGLALDEAIVGQLQKLVSALK